MKLVVHNPGFKNYEIPIFDAETYCFLAKYEIKERFLRYISSLRLAELAEPPPPLKNLSKPIENILNEIYLIPLQFVIENITEISEGLESHIFFYFLRLGVQIDGG